MGTVILSASKALGYNDQYKPLPEVLNSLSKDEKDELCTRMRDSLVNTSLMSKYFLTGALQQMVKAVQQDPETYESIKNMLKEWFITKKQYSFK